MSSFDMVNNVFGILGSLPGAGLLREDPVLGPAISAVTGTPFNSVLNNPVAFNLLGPQTSALLQNQLTQQSLTGFFTMQGATPQQIAALTSQLSSNFQINPQAMGGFGAGMGSLGNFDPSGLSALTGGASCLITRC